MPKAVKKTKKKYNFLTSKKFRIIIGVITFLIIAIYILLIIFARPLETLVTFPGKEINLKQLTSHPAGIIDAEFFDIPSSSGNNIHGLYIDNNADKTVYYFHGNGAPMDHFYTEMRYISDLGYNLISYDFPGYGKSTGEPTQLEVHNFSHEFYKAMKKEKGLKDDNLIIWGYSIGTAVAIDFAKDVEFDKLVLFSPLASRYDMSQKIFGFPIQKIFFRENSYISKETIKHISNPTLIVHGNNDIVVPFEQGKEVFENSSAIEKYFVEIDDFGHSLITERYGAVLTGYITDFLGGKKLEKQNTLLDRETASKLLGKFKKDSYIKNLDLESDTSLTKYVDPEISFIEKGYIPEDMRVLKKEFIGDSKGNAQMRDEAASQLEKMAEAFYSDMGEKILVVSSYRSYNYQAGIKARGCPDHLCAKAGHSEHQSGLGVDFWSASSQSVWDNSERLTKFYEWLDANAHTYGFHNGYKNGVDVDGYDIEPWHWRYVGVELATYLKDNDLTFAQYYYSRNKG